MALILFGLSLPSPAHLEVALRRLAGVGPARSKRVRRKLGLPSTLRVSDLTPAQERALATALQAGDPVAGALREEEARRIQRLTTNGCRRGIRLRAGLPVNGQRTKSNAQTAGRVRRTATTSLGLI